MALLRFRITGSTDARDHVIAQLEGIEQIERIEEVADMMPAMNDDDSSSAGLAENTAADVFAFEIEIEDGEDIGLIRRVAEVEAREAGAVLEFVEEF
jgi:hypothetical protein